MSKSYNDPVKEKSRKALEDFVRKHLSFKRPKRMEVLCFPGAEQDGEAGLELKVYDNLGIPRKNITGLECDPERAERLRQANLGIEVVCATDLDYLKSVAGQDRQWDVISLDYCSFFTDERLKIFRLISKSGFLRDTSVLCTNFMARRENVSAQQLLRFTYDQAQHVLETGRSLNISDEWALYFASDDFMKRKEKDIPLSEARSVSIPSIITTCMASVHSDPYKTAVSLPWGSELLERIRTFFETLEPTKRVELKQKMIDKGIRCEEEAVLSGSDGKAILHAEILRKLDQSGVDRENVTLLYHLMKKPLLLEAYEGYKYTSNSGTPMMFDLFYWSRHQKEWQKYKDILIYDSSQQKYILAGKAKNFRAAQEQFMNVHLFVNTISNRHVNLKERMFEADRIDLGSSYVKEKGRGKLSKDEAIALLEGNVPISEILETYSGFTEHQLRAFRAHITMGTYDKEESKLEA